MQSQSLSVRDARDRIEKTRRRNAPFEQKAREALDLGKRYLGVDSGHLTRIDTENEHWEATVSTDTPDGQFPDGVEGALQTTYCRQTIEADKSIAIHDAPAQGWNDDPAFKTHELGCYYGTTLKLNDELYGTLCFVADEARAEAFQPDEILLVDRIKGLLQQELENQRHQTELTRRRNLVNVLNRVLRHNMRNDMSVIRGRTQLIADQLSDPISATIALEKIDDLIELSEKAREVEEIVIESTDRTQTAIGRLVENIVADVGTEFPAAEITLETDAETGTEISADVLPSFERAVRELVENAVKHGDVPPMVAVTVEHSAQTVEVCVADTGPGLSEQEREVLKTGVETPLIHGSGLGLWLVHWVITDHGGTVEATVTDTGTTMTASIPRVSGTGGTQDLADLHQARDQYNAAFKKSFDAHLLLDDHARVIDANPAAATIYGLEQAELRGRSLSEFSDAEFDFDSAWATFKTNDVDRGVVTVSGADGQLREVEYSATANIVPDQHLLIARDVTERQQRRADLERYETVFNSINDVALICDETKQLTFANDRLLTAVSSSREQLIGTPLAGFADLFVDPAAFSACETLVEKVLAGTVDEADRDVAFEIDGKRVTVNVRMTPIPDDDSPAGVAIIGSDITERKRREQALATLKDRYETLIEAAPSPVFVADYETGEILETNAAAETLLERPREEIVGQHQSTLHPPEQTAVYRQFFQQEAQAETRLRQLPDGSPIYMMTDSGEQIPIEISVDTVTLPSGPAAIAVFREITGPVTR
jgi:PAS domain S-box